MSRRSEASVTASVVIPCYNMGRYVGDAVESVKNQTFGDWELIIVNDGSTDDTTAPVLESLKAANPEIAIVTQVNKGLAEARNSGVRAASGRYIVCLDADDMLAPEYLAKAIPVLEKGSANNVAVVTTWLKEFGEREDVWKTSGFELGELLINNVLHAASMFTKAAWAEVGGYDGSMRSGYEDWNFWLSMAEHGYRWECIPEPLFNYRIRSNSMLASSKADHFNIYSHIYNNHEKLFQAHSKELLLNSSRKLRELYDVIAVKDKTIATMNSEVTILMKLVSSRRVMAKLRKVRSSVRTALSSQLKRSKK
jgi:glycosyltransferase involved in cell wall biosynthesis